MASRSDGTGLGDGSDTKSYIITLKDKTDKEALARVNSQLKLITEKDSVHSHTSSSTNEHVWWVVDLSGSQFNQVRGLKDVEHVEPDILGTANRTVIDRRKRASFASALEPPRAEFKSTEDRRTRKLKKRHEALTWVAQEDAAPELVGVSQPPGSEDLSEYDKFIFESTSGEETYIYHIELGFGPGYNTEMPKSRFGTILQTQQSIHLGQKLMGDDGTTSHSTCVADKAAGTNNGASKKAKLIEVKVGVESPAAVVEGLDLVKSDIAAHPERRRKSIVLIVIASQIAVDPNSIHPVVQRQRKLVKDLMNMGVLVVASAGNYAEESGRKEVDTIPSVFASHDFPLIVVGNVNYEGEIDSTSQRGEKVVIYAFGEDVTCQDKDGHPWSDNGTSFSAPIVAGVLANLISRKIVPFVDSTTTDENFATQARDYLSDTANWERECGVKVIWNGVTQEIYDATD